jgi:GTP-binding protein
VINKVDRDGARPDWVLDQTFDLFDRLGATDEQLDFPVVYASALGGYAGLTSDVRSGDMAALMDTVVEHVPKPDVQPNGAFRMQISTLDYSSYVGAIAIGRIDRGSAHRNMAITVIDNDGKKRNGRILQVLRARGLEREEIETAGAGDIVAVTGLDRPRVSETVCDPAEVEALPMLSVDEPTVSMTFQVNTSPFAGLDGKYLTSRQIDARLQRELIHNVALRVESTEDPDKFSVSGRGELHLGILIETMRREGYELAISKPQIVVKEVDGKLCEPFEQVTIDVEDRHQGAIMEMIGERRGDLTDMVPDGKGRVRLDYVVPARGLIGLRTGFLTATSGTGLIYHSFSHYGPISQGAIAPRVNGVMISNMLGKSLGYSLFTLQERGRLFVSPGDDVYEGMVVGLHARNNDLVVNPTKAKQLNNIRAAGNDENILLTPPQRMTLEQALEFIEDDELVEVTPKIIRLRKRHLKEHERKKASRASAVA